MKLWGNGIYHPAKRRDRSLRHEFVVGPLCDSSLSERKARLYYCIRCKWNFLVCGSKVAVLDELAHRLGVVSDRIIYVGDGSSDVHVMLHVNNGDGFTIAVSENSQLARIAKSTVLSDSAFSILVPVLNQVLGMRTPEIRALFESNGLMLHDWERARTDRVMIREAPATPVPAVG